MVIVTGLVNIVPLGSKSTTGPAACSPDAVTDALDDRIAIVTSCDSAPAGTVIDVPASVALSAALTVTEPPWAPIDALASDEPPLDEPPLDDDDDDELLLQAMVIARAGPRNERAGRIEQALWITLPGAAAIFG
jgi:hypothetical protein